MNDTWMIETKYIRPIIADWVKKFNKAHPPREPNAMNGDKDFGTSIPFFGSMQWLVQEAGIAPRTLYAIMNEREYMDFTNAEKILLAIDREYLLANGEIPVISRKAYLTRRRISAKLAAAPLRETALMPQSGGLDGNNCQHGNVRSAPKAT